MWIEQIKSKIQDKNIKLVLPESYDTRILQACSIITHEKLGQVILLGDSNKIKSLSKEQGIDISGAKFINPETFEQKDDFVQKYLDLRKDKGISQQQAKQIMAHPIYFSAMLVAQGIADCYVAGCVNPTAEILRAALQIIKPAKGIKTVSSSIIQISPKTCFGKNGIMLFSDVGVVPDPSAEELADIAIAAAKKWEHLMDEKAKVAMLSFSTKGSAKHASIDKVITATNIVKERHPEIIIDGELQLDAAIIPEIAETKAPGSPVAGKANVLIFPNLNTGNICYKFIQRLGDCLAYGPILQGLSKPCSDLSRGCSAQEIVDVSAIVMYEAVNRMKN